jgi:hypothetical protein
VLPFNRGGGARVGRSTPRPRVGYAPQPGGARTGAACETQTNLQPAGSMQPYCYGMQDAGPIPLGAGEVVIPKQVAGVNGVNTLTLQPKEGFTIEDIEIGDPSGRILVRSVFAGRCDWLERGPVSAAAFQSAKTMCKMLKGFNSFPASGVEFTFENPTLADVPVTVTASGWPIPCPQGRAAPGQAANA